MRNKIVKALLKVLRYKSPKTLIDKIRINGERMRDDLDQIRTTLNGEDKWFMKVCDSTDPEEKECPPDYVKKGENHVK